MAFSVSRDSWLDKSALRKTFPESTAQTSRRQTLGDRLADALGGGGPGPERGRQERFDAAADRLRQNGRRAIGGNADHHRRAVDDGAELHVAMIGFVDGAADCADRLRGCMERGGLSCICRIDHCQHGTGEIFSLPATRDADNLRAGRSQQLGLPRRARRIADHHRTFALQVEEHRQLGQCANPLLPCFSRLSGYWLHR
jgi:hypothetical protein